MSAWSPADLSALAELGTSVSLDPARLHEVSGDFGNLVRGRATAIAQPRSEDDLAAAVRFAHERELSFTTRAFGRSAGGQSIAGSGVALDMSRLDTIDPVDVAGLRIVCGPGATWRAVVQRTLAHGLLPRVLPLNLDLSVGGTVSVGGVGANSHRFGMSASNVEAVVAVTGDGRRVTSSSDPEVLDATLGALGSFGAIASVTLELRRVRPQVRTYALLYEDADAWMEDQARAREQQRFDYMEGFCSAAIQGLRKTAAGRQPFAKWLYGLHVSVEHDGDAPPAAQTLDGMRHRWITNEEDSDAAEYTSRADARFAAMVRAGAFAQPHPWMEWFVAPSALGEVLPAILPQLLPVLGDGQRVVQIAPTRRPPLLVTAGDSSVVLAVLPPAVSPALLGPAQAVLRRTDETLAAVGARRYLAGWLEMDEAAWRRHYGAAYETWARLKEKFDPTGVFSSVCIAR